MLCVRARAVYAKFQLCIFSSADYHNVSSCVSGLPSHAARPSKPHIGHAAARQHPRLGKRRFDHKGEPSFLFGRTRALIYIF